MKSAFLAASSALAFTLPPAAAYDLFHPVPGDEMRELSADRPDTTESPVTVDAGHVQIEASLFDWRRDGRDDVYTAMATNFKIGLTDCTISRSFSIPTRGKTTPDPRAIPRASAT